MKIRREDVRNFLAQLRSRGLMTKGREDQKLSLGTIKKALAALRGCLNQAVEDGHLPAKTLLPGSGSFYGLGRRFGSTLIH